MSHLTKTETSLIIWLYIVTIVARSVRLLPAHMREDVHVTRQLHCQWWYGHNFVNWHLTLRSFHYSLYVRWILSSGRALGPFGGLSTRQLMLPAPHGKKERRWSGQCHAKHAENAASVQNTCLDKIVCYLHRIFNRNQKLKQQVSKLSALELGVFKNQRKTFSSAFSSIYAKTRTSNFRKVVRQHTEGVVRSVIWVLLQIYLPFQQWKSFENPLRIDKVIAMSLVYYFLGHSVDAHVNLLHEASE